MSSLTETQTRIVAVVGAGSIGTRHRGLLDEFPGVRSLVVTRREPVRKTLSASGVLIAENLLAAHQQGAHVAVIASETARHKEDALSALGLGMDVLIEKPLAARYDEGLAIYQAACRGSRKAGVGCVLRFNRSLQRFKQELSRTGALHSVSIRCGSYLPDWRPGRDYRSLYSAHSDEGGVMLDLIHEIDYAGWIFGWPQRLSARTFNTGHLDIQSEEMAHLDWTISDRTCVHIDLDYLTRPSERGVIARGENGILKWDGITQKVSWTPASGTAEDWADEEEREEMYKRQLEAFLNGPKEGEAPASLEDGLRALAIVEAAKRSASSGKDSEVNYGGI